MHLNDTHASVSTHLMSIYTSRVVELSVETSCQYAAVSVQFDREKDRITDIHRAHSKT